VFKSDGFEFFILKGSNSHKTLAKVRMGPYEYFTENANWNSVCVDKLSVSHVWRVAKGNLPSGVYSAKQRTWIQWNFVASHTYSVPKGCEVMLLLTVTSAVDESALSILKAEPYFPSNLQRVITSLSWHWFSSTSLSSWRLCMLTINYQFICF